VGRVVLVLQQQLELVLQVAVAVVQVVRQVS
jgi:hypothetical protein